MTTAAPAALELDLPEGFVVLAADAPSLVDVGQLPGPLTSWYDEVTTAAAAAGASLVALQLEATDSSPEPTAVSLVLHVAPLDPVEPEVAVQGLRAIALARTSTSGEVGVLDLPLGAAVGSADVQDRHGRTAAVATVQLPLASGLLVTLTLSTPAVERIAALAALAAAVAARLRPAHPEGRDARDHRPEAG